MEGRDFAYHEEFLPGVNWYKHHLPLQTSSSRADMSKCDTLKQFLVELVVAQGLLYTDAPYNRPVLL